MLAVFSDDGELVEKVKFPTAPDYSDFLRDLAASAGQITTKQFTAGGIGIRGNVDREAGLSLLDDVLFWGRVEVRDDCENIFGCRLVLENDSKLAGLSEAILIKDEFNKVLYITISTGIGSSYIIGGVLDQNTINSEIGKGVYEHEGAIQQWEDFASGKAIVAKYHKLASEIDDPVIWREISRTLALGLIDAAAAFTPEVMVFGGGVGAHFEKFKEPLLEEVAKIKPEEITFPELRKAQRPEEAVIYGCYDLARQHHEQQQIA